MKRFLGPLCFVCFCFLIAFRDVLIDKLQVCIGSSDNCIHPTFLLLTWSLECTVLAWMVRAIRKKSFGFLKPFLQLQRQQQLDFIKLGAATWVVYVVTINGIRTLSSPVFNLLDYGVMPMFTLLTAFWITKQRIYTNQIIGGFLSLCGIVLLLSALIFKPPTEPHWHLWIALSFLSPLFTSICSALQHRQVAQNMTPDEVLLYRFPIPAVLMAIWFCIAKLTETADAPVGSPFGYLPALLLIGAVTVFLPLWLLCYAFVRSSVGQLASYLFLIAVFTFALARILVQRPWNPTRMPFVWISGAVLLLGYMVAEGLLGRRKTR